MTPLPLLIRRYAVGALLQVLGWVFAVGLFCLIRHRGLEDAILGQGLRGQESLRWGMIFFVGGLIGLTYVLLDVLLDGRRCRQWPYLWMILAQTGFHLALLLLTIAGLQAWGFHIRREVWDFGTWADRMLGQNTLVILLYSGAVGLVFNFIKQVDRKFGPGNLWGLMLGRYYHPRREHRIFLFLDLKGSTSLAERLGHERYSAMIQDCFRDLAVVLEHAAGVYQYVGDEAVLSWALSEGLEGQNCLRAYFRFQDQIHARADHYQRVYGVVPHFKAGGNLGEVTGVEVGEIKREIAYHGDVLNVAARVQSLCNEKAADLLISGPLQSALDWPADLVFEPKGAISLRGRAEPMEVFAVLRRSSRGN